MKATARDGGFGADVLGDPCEPAQVALDVDEEGGLEYLQGAPAKTWTSIPI